MLINLLLIKKKCSILNAQNRSSEPMLMKLLYTICVPHLTYASEAVGSTYTSKQLQSMNVALNESIRRRGGGAIWIKNSVFFTIFAVTFFKSNFEKKFVVIWKLDVQ